MELSKLLYTFRVVKQSQFAKVMSMRSRKERKLIKSILKNGNHEKKVQKVIQEEKKQELQGKQKTPKNCDVPWWFKAIKFVAKLAVYVFVSHNAKGK